MKKKNREKKMKKIDISKFIEKLQSSTKELESFDPTDWLLALFYAASGNIPSKTHVQKALFLASRYSKVLNELFEFKAYRMGPWSEEVSDLLEQAQLSRLINYSEKGLTLSQRGVTMAEVAWNMRNDREKIILREIASFIKKLTEDELLLYVYIVYGYSEKSDVINKLLRKRSELAVSMLLKGIISIELAAKIAGMPVPKFIKYLRKRGIKPFKVEVKDIENAKKL